MTSQTALKAFLGCALLGYVFAAGASFARSPGPHKGNGSPSRLIEQHADQLGLDDETLDAIQEIVKVSRKRGKVLRGDLHAAHEVMRSLLSQEVPDESAVMQQAEVIGALELEARKNRLRAMLQIRALLTPGQREELVRIREASGPRKRRGPLRGCRSDLQQACPEAEAGRASFQCLSEHWDELSSECRDSLEGKSRRGSGR